MVVVPCDACVVSERAREKEGCQAATPGCCEVVDGARGNKDDENKREFNETKPDFHKSDDLSPLEAKVPYFLLSSDRCFYGSTCASFEKWL
jgi:hypothetical protein